MATNEMAERPTDDELAQWHEDYFGCAVYDADTIPAFRAVLAAENVGLAAARLEQAGWSHMATEDIARALRSRFPQPITDAVLRAEGFEPDEDTKPCWRLVVCERAESDGQILAFFNPPVLHLSWYEGTEWIDGINVRTPDRLHDVRVALESLYGPGED